MSTVIKVVQGDTRPSLVLTLTDEATGAPINIEGATPRLKLRETDSTVVKEVLVGTTLPGRLNADGTVTSAAPYDASGSGGRMLFAWTSTALDTAGYFEAEIEVTFADGTIQSAFDLIKLRIRDDF